MRRTSILWWGLILLLLPACQQDTEVTPTPGTTPQMEAAPPGAAATSSLESFTWADPLADCTAGITSAACAVGRDLEMVTATVGDASVVFELTLTDGHWLGEQSHLTFLLFDLDKDSATGDTDYAMQYGVAPEVTVVAGWQNQRLSLNVYRQNEISALPLTNVEVRDERTLWVQVPIRILGAADFDFAAFVLGADAVRDDFPNDGKIAFPRGEMVDKGE